MNRTGKIARLPRPLREELNRRLERNIPGRILVNWLNSLPEVQETMENLFQSKPVSPQNLSEWRQGGFAEWQTRNDLLERLQAVASSSEEIAASCGSMADHAACLLSAQIALVLSDPKEEPNLARLKHLSSLIRDIATLRRGDHSAARLKMERHVFDLARQEGEARNAGTSPANLCPDLQKSNRDGLAGPDSASGSRTGKSNLIKPDQTMRSEASAIQDDPPHRPPVPEVPRRTASVTRKHRPAGSRRKPRHSSKSASGKSAAARRRSIAAAEAA